jgi:hypothetical protein
MAKTKISEYDVTAGNNTDINSINIDEGCSPSGINNAIRALMSHLKNWQSGVSGDSLPIASGGTGAVTASAARTALSVAASGANSDITSLTAVTSITGLTTPLSVAQGGTGGSTASAAKTSLSAASSGANSDITSITGLTTPLTVAQGGIGAGTLTSGSVIVGAGTSTPTFVAPTTTGNVLFTTNGTSWSSTAKITSGTSQATTSGTSFDFTSIPSWVKRVTIMINNFNISASTLVVRLGTSGGIVATGYVGSSGIYINGNTTSTGAMDTTGFSIEGSVGSGYGVIVFTNITGNTWMGMGNYNNASTRTGTLCGSIALSSALTQLRLTTVSGTATFSSGSVNIIYE